MLPNVDPELLQTTLNTELQFNSNYYRIHTPQEIEDAERSLAAATQVEKPKKLQRRLTQKEISFPATPE